MVLILSYLWRSKVGFCGSSCFLCHRFCNIKIFISALFYQCSSLIPNLEPVGVGRGEAIGRSDKCFYWYPCNKKSFTFLSTDSSQRSFAFDKINLGARNNRSCSDFISPSVWGDVSTYQHWRGWNRANSSPQLSWVIPPLMPRVQFQSTLSHLGDGERSKKTWMYLHTFTQTCLELILHTTGLFCMRSVTINLLEVMSHSHPQAEVFTWIMVQMDISSFLAGMILKDDSPVCPAILRGGMTLRGWQ